MDFKLSEETIDNLSNLGVHDDEEEKEEDDNDNTVVQQQESLQEKIFVLEKKIKELENNEQIKDLAIAEKNKELGEQGQG